MLVFQVAAGIVLAYAIIVNQKKLLTIGGWLLVVIATLVAIGGIVWAGIAAAQFVGVAVTPEVWQTFWTLLGLISGLVPVAVLAFTGSFGMLILVGLLLGKNPQLVSLALLKATEDDPRKLIGLIVLTLAINFGFSFPLWAYTSVGGWYEGVDAYGRANGWADWLSILFVMLLWQWVWIPLGVYLLVKRPKLGKAEAELDEGEVEQEN